MVMAGNSGADIDLSSCDREPIHIPGSIQPHGYLIAVDDAFSVRMISQNLSITLRRPIEELLGQPLEDIVDAAGFKTIVEAQRQRPLRPTNPLKVSLRLADREAPCDFDCILHASGKLLIVELEARKERSISFKGFYATVQSAILRLQGKMSILELCNAAAEEIRKMTGFDRVMVYRFDRNWHGEVIAESKVDSLSPFLGLHYPASDIPVQARRLYTENWLRLIEDVNYKPVPLIPELNPLNGQSLDLSQSVLRSVSPVHCQYLRNMGVAASMSISLLRDGKELWGLIACHHNSSKLVPYEARLACEFLGQTISLQISSRERNQALDYEAQVERLKAALIEQASVASNWIESLTRSPQLLLDIVRASGACIYYRNEIHLIGTTPSREQTLRILEAFSIERTKDFFATEELQSILPWSQEFAEMASGLLTVVLGKPRSRDRVIWFRQEALRTVNWAGAPEAKEMGAGPGFRLSPRGSFALWKETVRHTSFYWEDAEIKAAQALAHTINRVILAKAEEIALLNEELNAAARAKDEFLAVVSHELRTPLNAILGWIELLQAGDIEANEYSDAFATIRRNASAQQRLIDDLLDVSRIISGKMQLSIEEVNLYPIIQGTIEAIRPAAEAKKIEIKAIMDSHAGFISGDPTRLQQIAWNLLANAVKFTPKQGKISVRMYKDESSVRLSVSDNGEGIAPEILPFIFDRFKQAEGHTSRRHQGLGLGLSIVRHLVELHGGRVWVFSEGAQKGSTFEVSLPISPLIKADEHDASRAPKPLHHECPPQLAGLKVLLVDDEPDARRMIEKVLTKCDVEVFSAGSAEEGLALLDRQEVDVIISDIGMPLIDGYGFIKAVRARSPASGGDVMAIALTAFARSEDRTRALLAGFSTHLAKPVSQIELLAVLASVSGRNRPARS